MGICLSQAKKTTVNAPFFSQNTTSFQLTTVPLPLGCRDPPGLADEGAVVVSGVACDVGMIVSMP